MLILCIVKPRDRIASYIAGKFAGKNFGEFTFFQRLANE